MGAGSLKSLIVKQHLSAHNDIDSHTVIYTDSKSRRIELTISCLKSFPASRCIGISHSSRSESVHPLPVSCAKYSSFPLPLFLTTTLACPHGNITGLLCCELNS